MLVEKYMCVCVRERESVCLNFGEEKKLYSFYWAFFFFFFFFLNILIRKFGENYQL
jgi:hypothetical protein